MKIVENCLKVYREYREVFMLCLFILCGISTSLIKDYTDMKKVEKDVKRLNMNNFILTHNKISSAVNKNEKFNLWRIQVDDARLSCDTNRDFSEDSEEPNATYNRTCIFLKNVLATEPSEGIYKITKENILRY